MSILALWAVQKAILPKTKKPKRSKFKYEVTVLKGKKREVYRRVKTLREAREVVKSVIKRGAHKNPRIREIKKKKKVK